MGQRRGGIIFLKIDGVQQDVKGQFEYSIQSSQKEAVVGHDGVHGYKELPVAPMISGVITDRKDLSLKQLAAISDSTITLQLGNDKVVVIRNAWFSGELKGQTEEGEIPVKFEGLSGEEFSL